MTKLLVLALLLVLLACAAATKNDLIAVEAELALLATQLGAKSTAAATTVSNLAFGAQTLSAETNTLSAEPKTLSVHRAELAALVAQVEGLLGAKVVEHNDGTLALAYSSGAATLSAKTAADETPHDPPAKVPSVAETMSVKAQADAPVETPQAQAANVPSAATLNHFGVSEAMVLSEPVQQHPVLAAVHGELSALIPTIEALLGAKISQQLDGTVVLNYGELHDGPATTLSVKSQADAPVETPQAQAANVPSTTTLSSKTTSAPEQAYDLKAELAALLQSSKSAETTTQSTSATTQDTSATTQSASPTTQSTEAATQSASPTTQSASPTQSVDDGAQTLAAPTETPTGNNAPSTDSTKRTLTVVGIVVASVAVPLFLAVVAALVVAGIVIHRKRNRVPDVNELMLLENAHQD